MTNSDSLRPLTKDQIALLKQTFRMMDSDKLAMRFYTSLFVKYPEVKPLFPADLTELSTKIVSVFELVVHSFEARSENEFVLQPQVLKPLRSLGELHAQKGVENKYYQWVNEILIQSISAELPDAFSHEAEIAWKLALNHLTFAMLSDIRLQPKDQHATMRDSFQHIRSLLFNS